MRKLELLAPAKNLECGIAAIDCGADAVYIGAPRFGARAAAGNSFEDISSLITYAHQFGAKVYVTLNTIIFDDELDDAFSTMKRLKEMGGDAVLVQDMALVENSSGLTLHASTQTDNRDAKTVGWLRSLGFERVVLARETSLEEIRNIHIVYPDVELEAFVHGALCVSYSGACYASQHCFGRSANRGECAQVCRMKFSLVDADGVVVQDERYLLSLKDLCNIDKLEQLADAGVVSFKIEGRLKDISYVKNVVAAYSKRLNEIICKRSADYTRASLGKVTYAFTPDLKKTFNRGFTGYFIDGRRSGIFSPDTPKAIGEYVGKVKEIRHNSFNVASISSFCNGDGLCFLNDRKELEGFRVNRVEGNRLFPHVMPRQLKPGMTLYRNNDVAFENALKQSGTERRIPVSLLLKKSEDGIALELKGEGLNTCMVKESFDLQPANNPQRENILKQLSKWGNTIYYAEEIVLQDGIENSFIPSSILSRLRQSISEKITIKQEPSSSGVKPMDVVSIPESAKNVSNHIAEEFYRKRGVCEIYHSLESTGDIEQHHLPLMQCKHCLRFALGYCVNHGGAKPQWREPLTLRLGDGRKFTLQFDCKKCQMNIWPYEEN